jgi:hypothetical protein
MEEIKYWIKIREVMPESLSVSIGVVLVIRILVRSACKSKRKAVFLLPLLIQRIPASGQQTLSHSGYSYNLLDSDQAVLKV